MNETQEFYPSHLTKALIGGVLTAGFGFMAMVMGRYTVDQLLKIGTDVYPDAGYPQINQ